MAQMTNEELRSMTLESKLELIRDIIQNYELDENKGDWTERAQTVLWIASNGSDGRNWGYV